MFVAVEGSIASGKSSTARLLAAELGCPLALELTDRHPFLAEFYADPQQFAFETEIAFVLLHYHQLRPLLESGDLVTDFSPYKDWIFARMNLEGEDWRIFENLYSAVSDRLRLPDQVIFLDLPPEELKRRATARGRPYEATLPIEYLRKLRDFYEADMRNLGTKVHILEVGSGQSEQEVASEVLSLISTGAG